LFSQVLLIIWYGIIIGTDGTGFYNNLVIIIICIFSIYSAPGGKMQDVYKQLMNLKRIMLLLLLANAIAIALIFIPDFPNKIDEIATFVTSGVIVGIVYSYFTEKNKIINHKVIYIDKNTKKLFL